MVVHVATHLFCRAFASMMAARSVHSPARTALPQGTRSDVMELTSDRPSHEGERPLDL